jgi:DNA-directed RNA polymerase specialized sigma24 family protein
MAGAGMTSDDGGGLHDFVAGRYAELRRSAFLMCGDWALADKLTQKSLAHLVAEFRRTTVADPDAFVYSHLMGSFRRSGRRQRSFVATPRAVREAVTHVAPRHGSCEAAATEEPHARKIEEIGGPTAVSGVGGPEADPAPGGTGHPSAEARPGRPAGTGSGDPVQAMLVLDALRRLAPRCRAVLVLRHWDGFAAEETADMLGLADERVDAYEAAGLAALDHLLADEPAR